MATKRVRLKDVNGNILHPQTQVANITDFPTIPSGDQLVSSSDRTNWNGKSVVSGTHDGTNWTSLTVNGTTKNFTSGGGGSSATISFYSKKDTSADLSYMGQIQLNQQNNSEIIMEYTQKRYYCHNIVFNTFGGDDWPNRYHLRLVTSEYYNYNDDDFKYKIESGGDIHGLTAMPINENMGFDVRYANASLGFDGDVLVIYVGNAWDDNYDYVEAEVSNDNVSMWDNFE